MAQNETEIDFTGWIVSYNPTKEEKLKRLKQDIKRTAKMMNPQYRNAVERNKKKEAYNNMIARVNAEVHDSRKKEIIAKWTNGFHDND